MSSLVTNNKDALYRVENVSRGPLTVLIGINAHRLNPGAIVEMTHVEFVQPQVSNLMRRGSVRAWTNNRRVPPPDTYIESPESKYMVGSIVAEAVLSCDSIYTEQIYPIYGTIIASTGQGYAYTKYLDGYFGTHSRNVGQGVAAVAVAAGAVSYSRRGAAAHVVYPAPGAYVPASTQKYGMITALKSTPGTGHRAIPFTVKSIRVA